MKTITNILLILLVVFQACSPQKRLTRLLEHHPELTVADTLKVRDTMVSPMITSDTIIDLRQMTDTVFVEKERLSVKLFRQHDTLYVEGKCKADTIIRTLRVPVERIKLVTQKPKFDLLTKILMAIIGGLIIIILLKFGIKS